MPPMPKLRPTAVAGTWYPIEPDVLGRDVDRYLAAADTVPADHVVAVIVPHASLMYSGPVAAFAYKLLSQSDAEIAVVIGPSHFVGFEGVAICEHGAFATPFGPMQIAEKCAAALALSSRKIREHPTAHVREHSIEMQLPFLKRVLPQVQIVPLVMGAQRRETVYELARALGTALHGRKALLIASTDLSHYRDAATAAELDGKVAAHVERFDADGLMSALEACPEHACGGGAAVSVMLAAKAMGARHARILKYGDSGDVSGDKDAVVGYLAAAFTR